MTTADFEEIAHSGGTITFTIATDARGTSYQQSFSRRSTHGPMTMIALYALQQGIPFCRLMLRGSATPIDPPPVPGCLPVMVCSDSQGRFGHHCQACNGYWRSGPWPSVCPYCRHRDDGVRFLSRAQLRYVALYCEKLRDALYSGEDGEYTIDMDEVAAAVSKEVEKPAFYASEQSQQHKFTCDACGAFNDVLGRFAYCSGCGTRDDATIFTQEVQALRARVAAENGGAETVRAAVSAFDNIVCQYVKQLRRFVPLSRRRSRLLERRFHDLDETAQALKDCFDLDLVEGISTVGQADLRRMFHRRHVYEHHVGEARLKQDLSETPASLHQLLDDLERMTRTLHTGFHELVPPLAEPIAAHKERLAGRN
jgi:hypothetical protein